jgi:hypothetical protein
MNKGLMGLRRYQIGGGVGDPGDDWIEELLRQLQLRWMNTKGLSDTRMQDLALEADRLGLGIEGGDIAELDPSMLRFWGPDASIEDLISLSNLDITYGDPSDMAPTRIGPAPLPHAVPPLSDKPALWEDLRSMGIDHEDLIEGPSDILDQPIHDLAEAFEDEEYRLQSRVTGEESIDDLIRGAGGEPPLSAALQREADIASLAESDIWNVDDRYKGELPAYSLFDRPANRSGGIGGLLNRLNRKYDLDYRLADAIMKVPELIAENVPMSYVDGVRQSIPWGSIAAPLLAAAASPAALAAEQAFDFAISPESLGGTASEVPGAGRTWRESPHIDPSDKEVASFMLSLLPYTQHQLARPSTGSQRAIDELIRRAQAGTPVNRYRR